jgi:hypothetical protein
MIEYPNAKTEIENIFEFLKIDYNYKGPFEWQCAYEKEYSYINGKLYLNIGFDGAFFFSIGETNKLTPELSQGKLNLGNIGYKERKSFDLTSLLSKEEKIHHSNIHSSIDELIFWSNIIKRNSEILEGNWKKFSIKYKVLNFLNTKLLKLKNT